MHADALGSVRAVTDEGGDLVRRHEYLPFGEEWNGPTGAPTVRFTSKEYDDETGLYCFGARYLRADVGRFTTIDPVYTWSENLVDPQRWNRYSYVRNNPLRFTDPDGRVAVDEDQERKAAEGAAVAAGATLVSDGAARANYAQQAGELSGPGGSAARAALRQGTYEQLTPFGKAVTDYLRQSRVGQLDGKTTRNGRRDRALLSGSVSDRAHA